MEPWIGKIAKELGLRSEEAVQRANADQGLQPHVSLLTLLRLSPAERRQVKAAILPRKLDFVRATEEQAFKSWAHSDSGRLTTYREACELLRQHPTVRVWDALLMSDERYKAGATPVMGRCSWSCTACETELPLPHQLLPFIEECPACGLESVQADATRGMRLDASQAHAQLEEAALSTWAMTRRGLHSNLVDTLTEQANLAEALVLEADVPFDQIMELPAEPIDLTCDGCPIRYTLGTALANVVAGECPCPGCGGVLAIAGELQPREADPEHQELLNQESVSSWALTQGASRAQIEAAHDHADVSLSEALVMEGAVEFSALMELDEVQERLLCEDCQRIYSIGDGLVEFAARCPACHGELAPPLKAALESEAAARPKDDDHAIVQKQALVSWALSKGADPEELGARLGDTASLPKLLGELPELQFLDVLGVLRAEEEPIFCLDCGSRFLLSASLTPHCENVSCPRCDGALSQRPEMGTGTRAPRKLGQYRLGRLLGRGGMAEVFLAENAAGERVALKVLLRELDDPAFRVRFEREAQVLEAIDHPNIVRLYGSGVDEESRRHYIALEYVPGRTLTQVLKTKKDNRLTIAEAAFVIDGCARGLGAVHEQGVIHRDLKPSNVLVTPDGSVKLSDFGIALPTDTSARLTAHDEVLGTPHYLAPEFMEGDTEWSPAADLYALGVMAFRLVSGELPFTSKDQNYVKLFWKKQSKDAQRLSEVMEDVPPAFEDMVAGLLSRESKDRPSVEQVIDAVASFLPSANPSLVPDLTLMHTISSKKGGAAQSGLPSLVHFDQGSQFGDYLLEAELGRGGMGVVYKAKHQTLKRIVALKVLLSGALASEDERRRFLREAESAAALNHPHIVRVLDVGEHEGTYYLSMEFVEGLPLSSYYRGVDDYDDLLDLLVQVCDGVHHAHSRGIVHRDLKPDNIIIDEEHHPHVLDFGIAKRIDAEGDTLDGSLTSDGDVIGTLRYMPPEQAAGEVQLVDVRSDVYALGSILYELLAKRTPFTGSVREILHQIHFTEPRPPSVSQELPWELDAICLKALEKEQNDRYQSVLELKQDIERFRQGLPIRAKQATIYYRLKKWALRNKRQAVAAAVAATVFLSICGAWTFQIIAQEQNRKARIVQAAVEGWDHVADRRYVEASKSFDRALQIIEPDDVLLFPAEATQALPDAIVDDLDEQERAQPRIHGDRLSGWQKYVEERRHYEQANALVREVRVAISGGKFDEAAELLLKVRLLAEDDPEALELSTTVAERFLANAGAELEAALAEQVDRFDARQELLGKALAAFETARSLVPDNPDAANGLIAVREQKAQLDRDRQSGERYAEAKERVERAKTALVEAKVLAEEDPTEAGVRLRGARLDVASALERWPGLEEAKVAATRVAIALANLWLDQEKVELAEQELDLAKVYGLLKPEIDALTQRVGEQDRRGQAFRAHRKRGDAFYARGSYAQAQSAYELALSQREDSAVVELRSLCAALVEAKIAQDGGDTQAEREALVTARGFHKNPATLDARIEQLDRELYDEAVTKAEGEFSLASRTGAGWEAVIQSYERALGYKIDGAAALAGRADAYAEKQRPKDMLLVSISARLLVRGAAASRVREGEKLRFYIQRDEVTNDQFAKFVDAGGYEKRRLWDKAGWKARARLIDTTHTPGPQGWVDGAPTAGTGTLPVSGISWYEARAYARWSKRRLPTEQEWLLAACFDVTSASYQNYPWGNEAAVEIASRRDKAVPGDLQPDLSGWHVRDMCLNVSEWVVDRSHDAAVPAVRGLSFRSFPYDLERGVRDWRKTPRPLFRDRGVGFRCALSVAEPPPLQVRKGSR